MRTLLVGKTQGRVTNADIVVLVTFQEAGMSTADVPHFRPELRRPPGLVTSLSVVLVHPEDGEPDRTRAWLESLDPTQFRAQEVIVSDSNDESAELAHILADIEGDFVAVIGSQSSVDRAEIFDAVSELFLEGGDAAMLGGVVPTEDLVTAICRWLWEGGKGEEIPAVVIRRFAARWLFAGLDRTGNPDIEVQARAIGMALRIVVPGRGVINPPAEWTEHYSKLA